MFSSLIVNLNHLVYQVHILKLD